MRQATATVRIADCQTLKKADEKMLHSNKKILHFMNAQEAFAVAKKNPCSIAKRNPDGAGFIVILAESKDSRVQPLDRKGKQAENDIQTDEQKLGNSVSEFLDFVLSSEDSLMDLDIGHLPQPYEPNRAFPRNAADMDKAP